MDTDLRQTEAWAKHLEFYGWKVLRAPGNSFVYLRRLGFFSVIKTQRPNTFTIEDIKFLEDLAKKERTIYAKVEPKNEVEEKLLLENGYEVTPSPLAPPSTILIDLKDPEDALWKRIRRETRHNVKHAQNAGVKVTFYQNPSDEVTQKFSNLLKVTCRQRKIYAPSYKELSDMKNAFQDKAIIALSGVQEENPQSGCIILVEGNAAFYIYSGTTPEGRTIKSNFLLIWRSMLYLKESGVDTSDLEGIYDSRFPNYTNNWLGFSFFKRSFGGREVNFPPPYAKYFGAILPKFRKLYGAPLPI